MTSAPGVVNGTYRSILGVRDFRALVCGFMASQLGDWLYNVALLVYVYDETHSATWVAAATMIRLVPLAVLGPFAGVVADRWDRVTVMIGSSLLQWLVMVAMTVVVAHRGPAVAVILLAGLNTMLGAATRPAAMAAMPTLVGEAGLAPANALLNTVANVGVVAGPALGAVVLLAGKPVYAFAFNQASFLASAIAFACIRTRVPGVDVTAAPNAWGQFVDGVRAVKETPYVPVVTFLTFIGAFTYGAQTVQLVVYVQHQLGLSADGYGYLLGASGAGGVIGATVSNRLASRSRIAVPLTIGVVVFTGSQLLFAGTSIVALAIAVALVSGAGMVVSDVISETAISRAAPGELMGRIFASYDGISVGGMVLGALVAAPVLRATGTRPSLVILGAISIVATLACLPLLTRLDQKTAGAIEALAPTVRVLSALTVFTGASASTLQRLAAAAAKLQVGAGMIVVQKGDPADAFYVCTEGSLVVTAGRGRRGEVLAQLGENSYFGEIGVIEGVPRTATVTAITDCTLLRVSAEDFRDALTDAPAGMRTLAEGVVRGLARTHPKVAAEQASRILAAIPAQRDADVDEDALQAV
jgi:CRP-like cAMP-binding protein/predicted MFS family arabinose efflux permease